MIEGDGEWLAGRLTGTGQLLTMQMQGVGHRAVPPGNFPSHHYFAF
jgi:hypothetical protein